MKLRDGAKPLHKHLFREALRHVVLGVMPADQSHQHIGGIEDFLPGLTGERLPVTAVEIEAICAPLADLQDRQTVIETGGIVAMIAIDRVGDIARGDPQPPIVMGGADLAKHAIGGIKAPVSRGVRLRDGPLRRAPCRERSAPSCCA